MEIKIIQEVLDSCKPVSDFLKEQHPHCYVLISQEKIEFLEGTAGILTVDTD